MAYIKLEDESGRVTRVPVFNEAEDGSGTWHVPVCDTRGYLKVALQSVLDNVIWNLGTDGDIAIVLNSAGLSADEELTDVIEGTSVHPAIAANSLIISNITNDGDILILGSDGGNSKAAIFFDASSPDLYLYKVGGTWTAGTSTWTIPAFTAGGDISLGANKLKTTNLYIDEFSSAIAGIRRISDNANMGWYVGDLFITGYVTAIVDAFSIRAVNTNNYYFTLQARDTGAGAIQEVMRIGGAAIPFMSMPADTQVGFFGAAVVSQQVGADALNTGYVEADIDTNAELVAVINVITTEVNALRTATNNLGLTTVV